MRISINNSRDFLALLVRRKWWVAGTFIALSGALTLLVYYLPKVFVSETLILIRPSDVPDVSKAPQSTEQRLKAIEQIVLSRASLLQILREFGDPKSCKPCMPDLTPLNNDERVAWLRDQIRIVFETQKKDGVTLPLTYFRISYQSDKPELAQKVTSQLTTLFIKQDNDVTEGQISGNTEFYQSEVDKVGILLHESEEKLRVIKTSRLSTLPDSLEPNLRTLDRLISERKANSEALDRIATIRLTLEQQIAETPDMIRKPVEARQIPAPAPTTIRQQQAIIKPPPQPDKLALQAEAIAAEVLRTRIEEYKRAKQELDEAQTNRTPNHPDVQRAQGRLKKAQDMLPPELLAELLAPPKPAAIKPESAPESATTTAAAPDPALNDPPATIAYLEPQSEMMPNPIYRNLVGQLQQMRTEYDIRQREKTFIDGEIAKYTQRVENTPGTEQEIASVLRENIDLKKQHDEYSGKLAQAKLAESLQTKQKNTRFVIVDPANYPLSPEKPRKPIIYLWAGVFSLLFAVVLAIVVDVTRQRVWAPSEIESLWNVPVLVDIPEIAMEMDEGVTRKKWRLQLTSVMAAAAVYGVCLYGIYLNHGFILRQLDPLLQRIVYR